MCYLKYLPTFFVLRERRRLWIHFCSNLSFFIFITNICFHNGISSSLYIMFMHVGLGVDIVVMEAYESWYVCVCVCVWKGIRGKMLLSHLSSLSLLEIKAKGEFLLRIFRFIYATGLGRRQFTVSTREGWRNGELWY